MIGMKRTVSFHLLLLTLGLFTTDCPGQRTSPGRSAHSATVLWKITGNKVQRPSYLLGTDHLADAEWLYAYPPMKNVIDSTDCILTEAFTTHPPEVPAIPPEKQVKALPLLTEKQYNTLDSFFVARVGEGIRGNQEAHNMTVAQMSSAILMTLVAQTTGPNGVTKSMDLDLFNLYVKLGRPAYRLDRLPQTEFDSTRLKEAKHYLARYLNHLVGSDQPGWTIYAKTGGQQTVSHYKTMHIDYKLNEAAHFATSSDFDFVPMEVRNQEWLVKITAMISSRPCLIAVGLNHLRYRTGLIRLLWEQGYQVEPVMLNKP